MARSILGSRIRERRRQFGLTQVELARRLGISASYLNLIEGNKRRIAGKLLRRTAEELDVALEELEAVEEHRLLSTLQEIAHLPLLAGLGVETAATGEMIGRAPGWSRAIAVLARAERDAAARARALSDRLTHDPFLGETVHKMLTRISSIRSAAEILADYPDLPADERRSFDRIVLEEARALSQVGEALAGYFDRLDETERALTPLDEVDALFEAAQNRFPELEEAADGLAPLPPGAGIAAARAAVADSLAPVIADLIARQRQIRTLAGRTRATERLTDYAARALLIPAAALAARAREMRYDAERLATHFAAPYQTVCQRLTALPPGTGVPRFGFLQANAAGALTMALPLQGLSTPRYAAACPLWVLHRAQQWPETVIRQIAAFPAGERFVFVARARPTGETGFGRPRHFICDMLTMRDADAALTVYAPGEDAGDEPVGPGCYMCARRDCDHRVEDPFLA